MKIVLKHHKLKITYRNTQMLVFIDRTGLSVFESWWVSPENNKKKIC